MPTTRWLRSAQSSGIEPATLLSDLNRLLESSRPGDAEHQNGAHFQPVKIPNVHLDLELMQDERCACQSA